jgi:sulfinoalanine decarboxylase/sulfinoalanine decarboxylase/aspartate 1-decarboxylase
MQNNIQEDLKIFNELIEEFLKEEINNPISDVILPTDIESKLDLSLNDKGMITSEFKSTLNKLILGTPKSSSNLFFNQLFGGRHSKAVLGDLIAVFLNTSMATYKIAGPQVGVEKEILKKVCQLIGYNGNSGGTFPTGGSMSNFMSLIMARDRVDSSIKDKGINQKLIAYSSENSHYSMAKNASFSGIGKENVRYIQSNKKGKMDVSAFKKQVEEDLENGFLPFYVNATAGTTVLCAFDNVAELAQICKQYNIWLHLDGAFGGSVIFSTMHKHLVNGISETDSFCFNAHKTLGAPLSASVLVVKNKEDLYNSFNNDASYLYQTDDKEFNLGHTSFECGRRNNALKLWTMWKAIGTIGLADIIEHEFRLADFARKYVSNHPDYSLCSFEDSLSVCFNYKDLDPVDLCTKLYEKNKLMVGFGIFHNSTFIRLVTINAENSEQDILKFFKILEDFVLKNSLILKRMQKQIIS